VKHRETKPSDRFSPFAFSSALLATKGTKNTKTTKKSFFPRATPMQPADSTGGRFRATALLRAPEYKVFFFVCFVCFVCFVADAAG